MQNLLLVALGGALGASARYGVGLAAGRLIGVGFPWGTLIVNVVGCFVMGVVGQWLLGIEASGTAVDRLSGPADGLARAASYRSFIAIGFLGGLTTFSSFGWDTLRQLETGRPTLALANIAANLLLSLLAVWAGAAVMRSLS